MRIEHKYELQYSVGDTLVLKENGVKVSIKKKAGIVKGCEKYGRLVYVCTEDGEKLKVFDKDLCHIEDYEVPTEDELKELTTDPKIDKELLKALDEEKTRLIENTTKIIAPDDLQDVRKYNMEWFKKNNIYMQMPQNKTKIVLVKDGELREGDEDKLLGLGFNVVIYRNVKPEIVEV